MPFIQATDFNPMKTSTVTFFLWLSVTYPVSRTKGRGPSNPGRNLTVDPHHESWKKNCDKRRRGSRIP